MSEKELNEMWNAARPFDEWIRKCKREGRKPNRKDLTFIDCRCAAYGDWTLYRDTDGTYYEDYFSIGD